MSTSEIATSYAALILADEDLDVTPDKLQTLIKAAGIDDVESIWTTLFAKVGIKPSDTIHPGGGAAAAPTGGVGGGATAEAPVEQAKEEKKEEEKEESDEDMGFGLFD
ncbi:MAG: hypothetical protein L6R37_006317 [Teloschistes peruensis]|nr:MAG: hypothetical protein L6R37_006317 [Teloschistes peruensis]